MDELRARVAACRLCEAILEPRPVLRVAAGSRVLVVGQAPGSKVHASGRPWDDRSGDHLRSWLGVDRATFDDPENFGILPMAFCYPGKGTSGDRPPPPICATTWHGLLRERMAGVGLTLLVGSYAQAAYLPDREPTLTATVRAFRRYAPDVIPLPHPSWRSRIWMGRNPWFEAEVLPVLQARVAAELGGVG